MKNTEQGGEFASLMGERRISPDGATCYRVSGPTGKKVAVPAEDRLSGGTPVTGLSAVHAKVNGSRVLGIFVQTTITDPDGGGFFWVPAAGIEGA